MTSSVDRRQLSESLQDRLGNWKFRQALQVATDPDDSSVLPEHWMVTIEALATCYENSGWFGGAQGDIVRAAVWSLGVFE